MIQATETILDDTIYPLTEAQQKILQEQHTKDGNIRYTETLTDEEVQRLEDAYGNFKYQDVNRNEKTDYYNIAKAIIGEFAHFIAIGDKDTEAEDVLIYYYNDGLYIPCGKTAIEKMAYLIPTVGKSAFAVNNIVRHCKIILWDNRKSFDDIEPPARYINFKNGILDIETKTFLYHDYKFTFTSMIPHNYNPNATYSTIETFFETLLHTDDIPRMQEWFGYNLIRDVKFEMWSLFQGKGDNGKSKSIDLLRHMLGTENVAEKSIDVISKQFGQWYLLHKYADICEEIDFKNTDWKMVKRICSANSRLIAERKGSMAFDFTNYAKLTFATNHYQSPSDKTHGNGKRILVFRFNKVFTEQDRDRHIFEKLQKESEGLIIWALAGLYRLIEQDDFSNKQNPDDTIEHMENLENTVSDFVETYLESGELKDTIMFSDVYNKYADVYKADAKGRTQFGLDLKKAMEDTKKHDMYGLNYKRKRVGHNRDVYLTHLKWRNVED